MRRSTLRRGSSSTARSPPPLSSSRRSTPAWETRFGQRVLGFELKSERSDGSLVVKALHLEPGIRRSRALDEALDRALDRLRRTVRLERVVR